MLHLNRIAVVAAAIALLGACSEPTTNPVATPPQSTPQFAPPSQAPAPKREDTPWRRMSDAELGKKVAEAGGRVFIGFKDSGANAGVDESGRVLASRSSIAAAKALLRQRGLEFEFEYITVPAVVTRIPVEAIGGLRHHPLIEYIEPIFPGVRTFETTPWNVTRVNAPTSWPSSTGAGAKLLIIDSGVRNDHTDLAPAVIQSCESPPTNGLDNVGHGTNVAGIVAAVDNEIGVIGVAHGVALWSSKDGDAVPDPARTACGVEFGRTNGVNVINISTSYPNPNTTLTDAINGAYNQNGIVVVASAGNNNGGAVTYPATLSTVIAVSATDDDDAFASFSSAGGKVELAAPGTTITGITGLTTTCRDGTISDSCDFLVEGTSFAAPHVAAAAAILKAFNASWTNVVIRDRLQKTAVDLGPAGRDNSFGYGLIDIRAALDYVPPVPLAPPTNCTMQKIPTSPPYVYLKVVWTNSGQSGVSTEVTIVRGGVPIFTTTISPGATPEYYYPVSGQHGQFWAQLRHTKTGSTPSDYCVTNSVTI